MKKQPLSDIIREQFADFDKAIKPALSHHKVTCTKGCSHCCYLLNMILPVDAYYIATYLLTEWTERGAAEFVRLLEALRGAASAYMYDGITENNYFRQKIPCAFLRDGECGIYEARPGTCRYLYAVTPAENCSPAKPSRVGYVDLDEVKDVLYATNRALIGQGFGGDEAATAPLPLNVLWALDYVIRGTKTTELEIGKVIMGAYAGLPTPKAYMLRHVLSIADAHKQSVRLPVLQ